MIHSLPLLPHYTVGAPAVRALPSSAHLTILATISMTPRQQNKQLPPWQKTTSTSEVRFCVKFWTNLMSDQHQHQHFNDVYLSVYYRLCSSNINQKQLTISTCPILPQTILTTIIRTSAAKSRAMNMNATRRRILFRCRRYQRPPLLVSPQCWQHQRLERYWWGE